MNEQSISQYFGHVEWRKEFHRYYETHEIEEFLNNIMPELIKIGWPEESKPVYYEDFKDILSDSSNKRIRLISISNRLKTYLDDLKDIYENVIFFLKSDQGTQGKTKEDKKKYSELLLQKENMFLIRISKVLQRISDLSEAYKIKYDSTSRILSIVEYERKQTGRE